MAATALTALAGNHRSERPVVIAACLAGIAAGDSEPLTRAEQRLSHMGRRPALPDHAGLHDLLRAGPAQHVALWATQPSRTGQELHHLAVTDRRMRVGLAVVGNSQVWPATIARLAASHPHPKVRSAAYIHPAHPRAAVGHAQFLADQVEAGSADAGNLRATLHTAGPAVLADPALWERPAGAALAFGLMTVASLDLWAAIAVLNPDLRRQLLTETPNPTIQAGLVTLDRELADVEAGQTGRRHLPDCPRQVIARLEEVADDPVAVAARITSHLAPRPGDLRDQVAIGAAILDWAADHPDTVDATTRGRLADWLISRDRTAAVITLHSHALRRAATGDTTGAHTVAAATRMLATRRRTTSPAMMDSALLTGGTTGPAAAAELLHAVGGHPDWFAKTLDMAATGRYGTVAELVAVAHSIGAAG